MEALFSPEALTALLTLTFLEIVLGIDNILFITLISSKLPAQLQNKATQIGLFLAMLLRILLLFGIALFIAMQSPLFTWDNTFIKASVSGQSMVLFGGGLFLLYKSTKEIYEKVEHPTSNELLPKTKVLTLPKAILQITLINMVFSFDSILTAVGMTNGLNNALTLMVIAVVISVAIMMLFAKAVGDFVNKHPSLQVLGLSFLLLIGFMLLAEAAHLAHVEIMGQSIGNVPKGYLYFAISFSLLVEFINMKIRKNDL